MGYFRINTLGCGSAKPTLRHLPSSTVVDVDGRLYMVDCGEGAQLSLIRQGLKISRLHDIFITHLHGDHVYGIPGLVDTLSLNNTEQNLTIHTTNEGIRKLGRILEDFNPEAIGKIRFEEIPISEGYIFEDERLRVRTIPLRHRIDTLGFVFEQKEGERKLRPEICRMHNIPLKEYRNIKKGRDYHSPEGEIISNLELTLAPEKPYTYAHISDTAYIEDLWKKVSGVDLLMHETTYLEIHKELASERGHSTAMDAALTAYKAQAGHLLTGHYSSRYKDERQFLEEAQKIFPNTLLNNEGLCIDLGKLRRDMIDEGG
ncbi:MAG: ribonuclease Z [Prevotella sp.]|nr:ribonuclease Z [Bacteroides sp.]MCM1365928.1 ribonuclease Z [Prevotella sp.]MCM1436651.1 ribonuclease Z [Prevotella sp.]